jgi:DNA-binding response OmpR family regulator
MAQRVLVVEDEKVIRELLESWLKEAGYETRAAGDGIEGLRELYQFRPDLVVLDILMPKMDGFEFCRLARQVSQASIIILSGLGKEEDKVKGLELGADDYVVKPVPMQEFLARVAAMLRRLAMSSESSDRGVRYADDVLTVDGDRHEVWVRGERVSFTPTEFRLLSFLTERAGKTCTPRQILDGVWDSPLYSSEVVKWHIASLRAKIEENSGDPRRIVTVRGVGYRYDGYADPDAEGGNGLAGQSSSSLRQAR